MGEGEKEEEEEEGECMIRCQSTVTVRWKREFNLLDTRHNQLINCASVSSK